MLPTRRCKNESVVWGCSAIRRKGDETKNEKKKIKHRTQDAAEGLVGPVDSLG